MPGVTEKNEAINIPIVSFGKKRNKTFNGYREIIGIKKL
jgi:hypothetical protein